MSRSLGQSLSLHWFSQSLEKDSGHALQNKIDMKAIHESSKKYPPRFFVTEKALTRCLALIFRFSLSRTTHELTSKSAWSLHGPAGVSGWLQRWKRVRYSWFGYNWPWFETRPKHCINRISASLYLTLWILVIRILDCDNTCWTLPKKKKKNPHLTGLPWHRQDSFHKSKSG